MNNPATATGTSWRGTALVVSIMLVVATMALGSVTVGFRAWTANDARRQRVKANPSQLTSLILDSSDGRLLVPWGQTNAGPRVWLVTFMYTRCPSICSALGGEFARLQSLLVADPHDEGIGLLSISFDQEHDDVAALSRYSTRYNADPARWVVAVPDTRVALAKIEREMGVVVINDGLGGFAHNAAIYVVLANGRLVQIIDVDDPDAALVLARRYREWQ